MIPADTMHQPAAIVAQAGALDDAERQARLLGRCGTRARAFSDRLAALLWQADEAAVFALDREWRELRQRGR